MYNEYEKLSLKEDLICSETMNLLLNNRFSFTRKFDMERCEDAYENDPIDWDYCANGDPEWTFVLNRMDYCIDLLVYAIKTKDQKYAQKSKQLIFNWIECNCKNHYYDSIRTLDTAIRITVWNECVLLLKQENLLTEKEYSIIKESISWQVEYIHKNTENFQQFSNWGMMQAIGLLNAQLHCVDENQKNNEIFFKQHLDVQFFEDGMHHEQSSVYIIEVVLRMLQMRNRKYKTDKYYQVLSDAAIAIIALTNVNNKSIAVGDGDEIDTIGILQMIAYETKDTCLALKLRKYQLREEAYWHYGDKIINLFNGTSESADTIEGEFSFPYSGFEIIKKEKVYLSFQNGTIGGTHGHFDNLHVNYSVNNQKILNDCGRYTYLPSDGLRVKLKSPTSHNLIIPQAYTLNAKDGWKNEGMHMYSPIKKISKSGCVYLKSSHLITNDSFATRILILLPDESLVIADYFNSNYYVNFNFDYELKIDVDDLQIENVGKFKPIFFDKVKSQKAFASPIYNQLSSIVNTKVYPKDNVCINCFQVTGTSIMRFDNFEYLHYDRLLAYEKQYKMLSVETEENSYIVGIKMTSGANSDNCVKIDNEYIFGTIFIYDRKTKQKIIFEQ